MTKCPVRKALTSASWGILEKLHFKHLSLENQSSVRQKSVMRTELVVLAELLI